ncbi:histidinol-phosphate transaminase [Aureibacter tunicatorum]|uniref:Histidinol-phosphate aminotransferase n=1 Tax=Aureibacter tunicatorum TaxID=866807 RepID=A0AAE3XJ79_9BACT|nr:histidinol-phosphate transaminase [Aureibacter tunicatorum]MDR6238746.1 histidinol-phosphate aminotransferase [Aureibacter tunicatorum]BDD05323.1 histidinol-phosphate aminotransferase [Aureibacter tunicatorum]
MFNPENILRAHLKGLKPYTSARDEFSGQAKVFVDANENAEGSVCDIAVNRYPDPYQQTVKAKISQIQNVPAENIFLGNGSDEAIDLLYRAFCEPGKDHVLVLPPTYGMYQVSADINGIETRKVSLTEDFQIDLPKTLEAINERTKIIFLCTPNNPTGNLLKIDDIEAVLRASQNIVVVDEAYIDFADQESWNQRLEEFPNLIVIQTFSKSWGMAGLRLGMAFASKEVIDILNKIKPPYNINELTQRHAGDALDNHEGMKASVKTVLDERSKLKSALLELNDVQHIYPSDANFLLIKIKHARKKYEQLLNEGIVVRDRSKVELCEECLRISIGTASENELIIEALKKIESSTQEA